MKKIYLFTVLALVPLLTMCSGGYNNGYYGPMGGWGHMMNYGYGYGGMFMWILFLIVLGVAIYFVVQNVKLKDGTGQIKETPIDILKKRYAKGEITKEDFDRMKNELQ